MNSNISDEHQGSEQYLPSQPPVAQVTDQTTEIPVLSCFGFALDEKINLLIPHGTYSELVVQPNIFPLPNTPPHVKGLINLRGNAIVVYALNQFLSGHETQSNYALLIGTPEAGAAILCNRKPSMIRLQEDNRAQNHDYNKRLNLFSEKIVWIKQVPWILINIEKLFTALRQ